jgi:heparan-alpha-glucosaminide N-acetyltransferase
MNATTSIPLDTSLSRSTIARVVSIDIFRGLTMAVMIFVNALPETAGLPWWTYHAHARVDVMTYVDMVFPFFLFVIGMSLPLSITRRLKRNPSMPALWVHVVHRFMTLLALGLVLANAEKADPVRMGMDGNIWAFASLICAVVYLNVYPKSERYSRFFKILRIVGLICFVILFAIFRRTTHDGHVAWIDASYPEILGLIAYTYLAVAILYIPTRRWSWGPPLWLGLLTALCAFSTAKILILPDVLPLYLWPFGNGAMGCIVMAGVVTSGIFMGTKRQASSARAMSVATGFAMLTLISGWLLTPLGISKIRATPTWSLYSVGAAVLLFTLLYWVCDVKRWTRWAFVVKAAGANTMLTYLLPDLWYFLLAATGITFLDTHMSMGWHAVVKTLIFTLFILAVSAGLTRLKLRLQL